MIMDLGAGVYNRQYFSKERYTLFVETHSKGHSVPIIDGVYQSEGESFKASECRFENGVFNMDIAGAYNVEGLESAKRSFSFTDDSVTLSDEFVYSGNGDIVERMVSYHPITLEADGVARIKDALVTYDAEKYEVSLNREKCTFKDNVFVNYLDFKLKNGVYNFKAIIK